MSREVALCGFGGGSLGIKVKSYATEAILLAEKPGENTIGIITGTAISRYCFSATEPGYLVSGLLWIKTGATSAAPFNALPGSNVLMIYPGSAKQYADGKWTDVKAKTYQGGKWKDWALYLVEAGQGKYVFKTMGVLPGQNSGYKGALSITQNADNVTVSFTPGGGGTSGAIAWLSEFDLTGFSKLVCESGYSIYADNGTVALALWSSLDDTVTYIHKNLVKEATVKMDTGKVTLDISTLSGKYTVGFYYSSPFGITHAIKNFSLEPAV